MAIAPRERISGVDTAWLRMEQPTNLMMIVGVMMFEHALDLAAVRKVLKARFLAFHRFRQRPVQDAVGAWWETPEHFDIDEHVLPVRLAGRAGKRELEALVSELASTPLDPAKPLWQFHVVENYAGGAALITRIHHCYADGIALIQVVLSFTHPTAAGSLAMKAGKIEASGGGEPDFWAWMLKPLTSMVDNVKDLGRDFAGATGKGMEVAGEVAKLMLMGRDAQTRFKGTLGTRKRVAWATPLPLGEVKAVGKVLGCSINDVLLSLATGALRDYLVSKGDPVDGLEIRAIVPVNLRPAEPVRTLGNHFGLVFLDIPIGMDHPLERLYEIRRRMQELRDSYQPLIALALLTAVGYGPKMLQEQVTQLLGANASAVMTNVPGPQHALYFAGQRITEQDFWVPQSGGIGMGISILSYDSRIQFGVITDVGLVPDPSRIVTRFDDEFDKLMWLTLMSPWVEAPAAPKRSATARKLPKAAAPIPKRFRNL